MVFRGEKPGPVFGITAALHGNEVNGIPVIHQLFQKLDRNLRGTVVAVPVTNVPGYNARTRTHTDGTDLNTIMPGRVDGNDAQVYAYRLSQRIVRHFNFLVDLHTASFGRINSLYVRADLSDEMTAKMAYLQRPQIILQNQPSDGTLRGHAMDLGIPAITVEIGNPHRFQPEFIRLSLSGLRAVLSEVGMVRKRHRSPGPPPVLCGNSYWIYADHGGLLEVFPNVKDDVEKGQVIARLTNVFGDVVREYRAPEDGIVIGKSVDPVGQTGARILHLGQKYTDHALQAFKKEIDVQSLGMPVDS
nr:succinylglutamate desuccinylase/aspartoacylase family protein [Acanthopleuribacter pedis]